MPLLVIPTTVDTLSTDANCLYPAAPLGGSPVVSPNVQIGGKAVEFYTSSTVPDSVTGEKINPLIPLPCQPGIRVIKPLINKTVFINKQLPAVQGDEAAMLGTPRPLTVPFGNPTVVFNSRLT